MIPLFASRAVVWRHPTPVHPDEVSFVAALGFPSDYPVHAPGYSLWIALGSLIHHLGVAPYSSFAIWSLLASIVGPILTYLWLRPAFGHRLAWWTALAIGLCPLAWFHSVTAMTYWMATLIAIIAVIGCERAILTRRAAPLAVASIALSAGVFLRADCLVYFGPLYAYALLRASSRRAWGLAILPVAAAVTSILLMQHLYGRAGPTVFAERFGHSRNVLLGTSVFRTGLFDGLLRNIIKLGVNVAWNLGPLMLVCAAARLTTRRRESLSTEPTTNACDDTRALRRVLLLWLVPGLVFLALFHVVEGYLLWLYPAAYIGGAVFIINRCSTPRAIRALAIVAALTVSQFIFYPWLANDNGFKRTLDAKIGYLSAAGLRHIDQRSKIHEDGDFWRTKAHD